MIDVKRLGGILNKDDKEADIAPIQHIGAKNGRFYGGGNGLTFQNVKGNYIVSNSNLPSGTNECLGAFFDQVNQRIIWFNYNSNGNNGIYQLTINTGIVSKLFLCGTDSATDVLTFDLNYPICSAAIVYRPQGDGDLLYWTDGTNRPMYLNLSTVATLAPFTANMLYASKMPPPEPPVVFYTSDAAKNYNNVKNRYFRFATRWTYINGEKSTFSPTSDLPLAPAIVDPQANTDPNTNNVIVVNVKSGTTKDFISVEVFGQEFNGVTWGDFFLATVVDKNNYAPIPFTYSFYFYNDGIYNTIIPAESDLRFDYLPDKANALELLNGNTIIYGGITEGYDEIQRASVDVQVTSSLATNGSPAVTKAWKWGQNERLGLIYFDQRGKTNGVISFLKDAAVDTTNFDVTTPLYTGEVGGVAPTVPKISASINHLPPSWAVTYQWVRLDLAPPFFLQYVTNDYQVDNDYIYLCIESLVTANTKDGFVPSYEFTEGDRVRVMATYNGAVFSTQLDYQILEVVTKVMANGNPAVNGSFLKCKKPSSFPTPAYSKNMTIEIYTPPTKVNDTTALFYEWGQEYAIVGGYHQGQIQNQTASQPALFAWFDGYVYQKSRLIPTPTPNLFLGSIILMDRNYNDYQPSKANANSRGWPIDPNAKQEYFPVTNRWGGSYVQDTNINNLNRFYPQDLDTIDRTKGDIRRLKVRDRILRVFQDRGVGQYGVYAKYIQSNEGDSNLTTTDSIITANNINYYQGTYGLGGYPTNLCSTPRADYFVDVVTGREIRLAGDGITDLGLTYKGQFYFPQWVTPYNKQILRGNGNVAKILKFWDSFENEAHTILQAGVGSGAVDYPDRHYSFNEIRNGFCCDEYDYHPEWALSANDIIYSWKNGEIYKHDNTTNYCYFFGTQYDCYITVVFNPNTPFKKGWQSIAQLADTIWEMPLAYTDVNSYGSQRQETNLVAQEFTILESMPSSSIKRDSNSVGGKYNGSFIKGNWMAAKFRVQNAAQLVNLQEVICRYIDSPLTSK